MHGTQITFRNVPHSVALGDRVRELAEKLDRVHPQIQGCNVMLEELPPHTLGPRYHARVRVRVPGHEVIGDQLHKDDVRLALRDSFVSVRRQLAEIVRLMQAENEAELAVR